MILTRPHRIFVFDGPDEAYVSFLKDLVASIQREIETWEHPSPSLRQEAPTSDDFRIVPFDPLGTNNQLSKRQKPKPIPSQPVVPRWKTELHAFLASLPTNLSSSREAVGLNGNIVAVNALLAVDSTSIDQTHSPSAWTNDISSFTFSETATRYALTTQKLRVCAQFASLCARFREVILGCLSEVLHENEDYKELSDLILQKGVGNAVKESCRRLRRGARFANWCISQLSSTKWEHQGSELVYLSGRTLDQYSRIAECSDSFGVFDEHLRNLKWEINESSGDIPISIPCIIKCLVGNEITLDKICSRLGYDSQSTLDVLAKWYIPMYGQRLGETNVISPPSLESSHQERPDLCHSDSHSPRIAVRGAESAGGNIRLIHTPTSNVPNGEEPQVADGADQPAHTPQASAGFGLTCLDASSRPINQQLPRDQQCQSNGFQQQVDHESSSIHQKRGLDASTITSKRPCLDQSGRNTGQQTNIEDDSVRPLTPDPSFPSQGSHQATPPASSIAHSTPASAFQPPNHMPQHSMSPNEDMNAFVDLNMNHLSDLFFPDDSGVNLYMDLTFNHFDDLLASR